MRHFSQQIIDKDCAREIYFPSLSRRSRNSIKFSKGRSIKSIYIVRYDSHDAIIQQAELILRETARITAPLAFICPLYLNVINATIYILRAIPTISWSERQTFAFVGKRESTFLPYLTIYVPRFIYLEREKLLDICVREPEINRI